MNIGDYVRTKEFGIRKVEWFDNGEPILDNDFSALQQGFIKSSNKIIDLIKENDYVNGYRVVKEKYEYMGNNFIDFDDEINAGSGYSCQLLEKDIKSVVTKEQMESITYYV